MGLVVAALVGIVLGGLLVGLAMSHGLFNRFLPTGDATESPTETVQNDTEAPLATTDYGTAPADDSAALHPLTDPQQMAQIGTIEGRLALIEDRISRIDSQSNAASGNAARAEGLLIAFAARRMIDQGQPLNYVTDQLRLRFADAQPNSVQTIINFSKSPVTLDQLSARLEALRPQLSGTSPDDNLWTRFRREVNGLFVIRRDDSTLVAPDARLERARLMLISHRVKDAIDEVQRLPGAEAAQVWVRDARRYAAVQRALDLLETTAMLEPNRLHDSEGRQVDQPSPLAPAATPPQATAPAAPANDDLGDAGEPDVDQAAN
ncbi:MICOS complex subunit MIC60 [Novosphingobium sp. 9]|uniref:MICOS complex subunit MIC60 n=1 Tax=Novosphingobium sp. 9 TaxID=2025349 RepID=UPI0021B5165F|nr:MICOS complex subunit MIC60 [Novosphingobium sp. 9]